MHTRSHTVARALLVAVVAGGLTVDAWVHLTLASSYDPVRTSVLSQGDLFRAEGAAAILAAALLVLRPRRPAAALALAVAAGGLAAVLVYQYIDIGALGPLPNMYEPVWYAKKTQGAWGEAAAATAALTLLLLPRPTRLPARRAHAPRHVLIANRDQPP